MCSPCACVPAFATGIETLKLARYGWYVSNTFLRVIALTILNYTWENTALKRSEEHVNFYPSYL